MVIHGGLRMRMCIAAGTARLSTVWPRGLQPLQDYLSVPKKRHAPAGSRCPR